MSLSNVFIQVPANIHVIAWLRFEMCRLLTIVTTPPSPSPCPPQMEARSVTHLHSLNKGLERKIIELQLRLVEGERERQAAQELWNLQKRNYEEVQISVHCVIDGVCM